MTKALSVAKWEYVQKLRSKAFLVSLFVMPLIIIAFGVLPSIFVAQEDKDTKVLGVVDGTGFLGSAFAERMRTRYSLPGGRPNYLVVNVADTRNTALDSAIAAASRRVFNDEIEGYCIFRSTIMTDSTVEYRSNNVGDFRTLSRVEETVRSLLIERRLAAKGLDPDLVNQLKAPLELKTVKISKSGEVEETGFARVWLTSYVFLMMLLFLVQTSGQLLVRSFQEEKSNRIVEVLVSSCPPTQLMAGKVLGLSALGLTQLGFWGAIGLAVSSRFGIQAFAIDQVSLQLMYFVLGYLLYAAIFIAAGSPLTTEQEAQQVTSYLVLILIIPLVIALPAMQNPGAMWIKILTFIPFLTAPMMAIRIPVQTPPVWELIATAGLLAISVYAAMWAAGRIFRVAILATGKRPGIGEMIRWVRFG